MMAGIQACLITLASTVLIASSWEPTEGQMNQVTLGCQLELVSVAEGQTGLAFTVSNGSDDPVTVAYMEPFIDFSLTATADDGDVEIIRPMYDSGARRVTQTLGTGESVRIEPPFRLRFGPPEPPPGGPRVWTLVHDPAPLDLEAAIRVTGAEVEPCTARLDPFAG